MLQTTLPNGHSVDMGPNWIHGTNNNPILDLARLTRTATGSWDTQLYIVGDDGKLLSIKDGERYAEMMWGVILDAFCYSNKYSAEIDPSESLLDFFRRRVVDIIPETEGHYQRQRDIVLQMADLWGAYVGSPIARQSLKFFWMEECIEGGTFACCVMLS